VKTIPAALFIFDPVAPSGAGWYWAHVTKTFADPPFFLFLLMYRKK
jgi:hypothetical protein